MKYDIQITQFFLCIYMDRGHVGTSHFVLYREVVLSLEVKMYSVIKKGLQSVNKFRDFFLWCFIQSIHYQRRLTDLGLGLLDCCWELGRLWGAELVVWVWCRVWWPEEV